MNKKVDAILTELGVLGYSYLWEDEDEVAFRTPNGGMLKVSYDGKTWSFYDKPPVLHKNLRKLMLELLKRAKEGDTL